MGITQKYLERLLARNVNVKQMDFSVFHDQVSVWVVHGTGIVDVVRIALDLGNGT